MIASGYFPNPLKLLLFGLGRLGSGNGLRAGFAFGVSLALPPNMLLFVFDCPVRLLEDRLLFTVVAEFAAGSRERPPKPTGEAGIVLLA